MAIKVDVKNILKVPSTDSGSDFVGPDRTVNGWIVTGFRSELQDNSL